MKGRESGMPDEDDWSSFFDADGNTAMIQIVEHAMHAWEQSH